MHPGHRIGTVYLYRSVVDFRKSIGGLSAHADQGALLGWLRGFHKPPRQTFVVHGEATASANFAAAIHDQLGWPNVRLPHPGEQVTF